MHRLKMQFLGTFQVWVDGQPCDDFRSSRARALLAFLAIEAGRSHARSSLASFFWPELTESDALHNLRQTLVRIRKAIKDEQATQSHLLINRQAVQFNQTSSYDLDVITFESLVENGLLPLRNPGAKMFKPDTRLLEQALQLYQGEFLKGYSFPESYGFDEWLLFKREHLHRLALEVMHTLADSYLEEHDYSRALQHARHQLELDAWREEAHRQVMQALYKTGQRSAALAQYELCRKILAAELGVKPESETEDLYALIKTGDAKPMEMTASRPRFYQTNLPSPLTTFVGRDQELSQLVDLLRKPSARLITLMGEGGIGKTRLAVAAGSTMLSEMTDGVWYVSLAEVIENFQGVEPALVAAISSSLGLAFYSKIEPRLQLINFLHSRSLLLILDNFEHLMPGIDFILELLQAAPGLKLMVTSRERLNVQAEHTFRLKGLPVPEAENVNARQFSSVLLFADRAGRAWNEFSLTAVVLKDVIEVCRLVDGLPLAIELAAARTDQMSVGEIRAAIQQNIEFLTSSLRDLPARHRSLRAVLETSWRALSPGLQKILAQCAIFMGTFDAEAVTAIVEPDAAPEDHPEQAGLEKLLSQSLLRRVDTPLKAGRLELHVLVRQFAARKLQTLYPNQEQSLQCRYAQYYLTFVTRRKSRMRSPEQQRALAEIESEIENIRQVWFNLVDRSDSKQIVKLAPGLLLFYDLRGWYAEGLQMFSRAGMEVQAAHFHYRMGNFNQARILLTKSLSQLHASDAPDLLASCLFDLSSLMINLGDLTPGMEYAHQALDLFQQAGDLDGAANSLSNIGRIFAAQGNYSQSKLAYQQSLELRRNIGAPLAISDSLNSLGLLATRTGDYIIAEQALNEALDYKRKLDQQPGIADVLSNLGLVYMEQNRLLTAKTAMEEALDIHKRVGDRESIGVILNNLGDIANQMGNYSEAIELLESSLQIKTEMHNRRGVTFSLIHLGHAYLGLGNLAAAQACQIKALQTAAEIQFMPLQLAALVGIAKIFQTSGQPERAFQITQQIIGHPAVWKRIELEAVEISKMTLASLGREATFQYCLKSDADNLDELIATLLKELPSQAA